MRKVLIRAICLVGMFLAALSLLAQTSSSTIVFSESGFPAGDSAEPTISRITAHLPDAQAAPSDQLGTLLALPTTRLLVLPYGSAFPEAAWPQIEQFLQRGGNLLVIGGRPFTRSAYRDANGWHLRDYSVRFPRALMIDQYQPTPGSEGMDFQVNGDLPLQIPRFAWNGAYGSVIRLSAVDLYHRGGAAGSIDARVDPVVWGVKSGRKLAAPIIEIDHLRNGFEGGRWIFVNAELTGEFWSSSEAPQLVGSLAARALMGSEEFTARPVMPLYLEGEPIQLQIAWHAAQPSSSGLSVKIAIFPESQPSKRSETTTQIPATEPIVLPAPSGRGLYVVEAQLV